MLKVDLWGYTMEGVQLQILLAIAMFITTAVAGLLPLKLLHSISKRGAEDNRRTSWILTLLSCFAGGVFLATCFLDIFPHVNNNYSRYRTQYGWSNAYPLPEFMACIGFFFVYLVEELSLKVFSSSGSTPNHGHSHGPIPQANNDTQIAEFSEPLKMETGINGTSIIQPRGSYDISAVRKDSREQRYSVINTHEIVMDQSVRYVSGDDAETGFLKSLTFAFAMSLHSILEGFALGVQEDKAGIMTLFLSLIIHKGIEAFSVGLQVSRSNSKRLCLVVATIIVYALMTPVGAMIGVFLTNVNMDPQNRDLVIILMEGCAAGTFIYVTFFEVLAQERANDHSNLIQLGAIVAGFFSIAALQAHEHFGGPDEHGHVHG